LFLALFVDRHGCEYLQDLVFLFLLPGIFKGNLSVVVSAAL
jgi:hypothetical protein